MKTRMIRLALCAVAMLGAGAAFGSTFFHIPSTYADQTTASWDDEDCWWSDAKYTKSAEKPKDDALLVDPGVTVCVTNDITTKWSGSLYSFEIRVPNTSPCSTLHIKQGGLVKITTLYPGSRVDTHGACVIDAGGTFQGTLNVGRNGYGVVTNSGTYRFVSSPTIIGDNAAGVGLFVHDGGTAYTGQYAKDLIVGRDGIGDLVVKSGTFAWTFWYANDLSGTVRVGNGTNLVNGVRTGRITVENGAGFKTSRCLFGGDGANTGHGELIMRGGTYYSNLKNSSAMDNFYIGAATNGVGGIRADSYGAIRGWGSFTYADSNQKDDLNIYARLGNGKIEGDGEGVERTLDCSEMWQVTNVVFDAAVTSGWYAVNKGMVVMPGVKAFVSDGWQTLGSTNCVGCSKGLEKPDLVNAVRIQASWKWQGANPFFGAAVLAADRGDAHADALKKNQRPLGFWKAGTFKKRASWTDESRFDFTRAVIDFRYDHTALSGRPDTHIAVLRWDETAQAWNRVARYDTLPADHVASSGELTTVSGDARYSLGLFCVAEETPTGMTIVVK